MATVEPGCNFAVKHAAFESGRQNIAQHDKGFFVRICRNVVKAGIGKRNADIFGLGAIDLVAENPTAVDAMRVHSASAIVAFSARGDAGNDHAIAGMKPGDRRADFLDHSYAFMTQDATWRAGRHVAIENVQIGSADRRLDNLDDGIRRRGDFRLRPIFEGFFPGP